MRFRRDPDRPPDGCWDARLVQLATSRTGTKRKGCGMHRSLTATPVIQRLAEALGALITVSACAVALPPHARAATLRGAPRGRHPRGWHRILTPHGWANYRDCLKVARSASGTAYYNGVLELNYVSRDHFVGDVLGGKSMLAVAGHAYVNDCPRCGRAARRAIAIPPRRCDRAIEALSWPSIVCSAEFSEKYRGGTPNNRCNESSQRRPVTRGDAISESRWHLPLDPTTIGLRDDDQRGVR